MKITNFWVLIKLAKLIKLATHPVYADIGAEENDAVTVTITLDGTNDGLWDIKVSQIECSNPLM